MSRRWPTEELQPALERLLARQLGEGVRIAELDRRPSRYRTSFPIEELEVHIMPGESLRLLFKDLAWESLEPNARAAKPRFLHEPMREIELYERLLPAAGVRTAVSYGAVADPSSGRYWLFLEHVRGVELFQVGSLRTWQRVARWLAEAHERMAPQRETARHLLRYDREFLARWPARAVEYARNDSARERLAAIAADYQPVAERIAELPTTLIHGELYASNVLVDRPEAAERVCAVDWEMAGAGPGLLDLAALVSGRWSVASREAIAHSYREASPTYSAMSSKDFLAALDTCRLQIALQWLGWSEAWTPPPEHATDWLADAVELARRLRVGC